jgi:UDP-hydrolysing UDP-N-acetyl-D-glucosamine 2-epimerase
MGEEPWRIHVTGTPGLAGLKELAGVGRDELAARYGFNPARPFALLLFHPVVQDAAEAGAQWRAIFEALAGEELQILALLPNADHGTDGIRAAIGESGLIPIEHMPRGDYVSALRQADFLIGNSSSGIIEAATLGTAVVNVGDRQDGRLRSANVFDAGTEAPAIAAAIGKARAFDPAGLVSVYGEAHADRRIRTLLEETDLADRRLRKKVMTY